MNYDPRAKLDAWCESLLALGMLGNEFAEHAASKLVMTTEYGPSGETKFWMLRSCFSRRDVCTARMYVNDWSHKQPSKPKASVFKWVPGSHYYSLSEKFDTLERAILNLQQHGYVYDGLIEKFVYSSEA